MIYLYLILGLTAIAPLYPADEEKKPSQEEILQQITLLSVQIELCNERLDKVEVQIKEIQKYDKKLNRRIKEVNEKLLQQEKEIKDLRGYNEDLIETIDYHSKKIEDLDTQKKAISKQILKHEEESRTTKWDLDRITRKQDKFDSTLENLAREIKQYKR